MLPLYPDIKPFARHRLPVTPPHDLYIEECGDPDGIPVLFIHGGPGAGCHSKDRCFFNPEHYRIVLFDQRGAGRSTPHASLESNTTKDLLQDIEAIRQYLNIDRWVLFGGSWGATLGLLYAEAYPEQVLGMILRGVFLCREEDLTWFYQDGASKIFPDHWQDFIRPISSDRHHEIVAAYYDLLTGGNELARMSAAKAWALWEAHCSTLRPSHEAVEYLTEPHIAIALACIASHYFAHQGFLTPNQILNDIGKLKDIPSIIVHGRYDMICTLDNAVAVYQACPNAELHIIRDAGHSSAEPSIIDALIRASDDMAKQLRPDIRPST